MNFRSRAFSLGDEGKLRKLTYIRLVIATLVMGAAIAAMQLDNRFISVVAMYSLLGAIYLTTGSSYIIFRTGVSLRPILWIQICVDMAVLTMMVHYSGGSGSYFAMLYILPIIVGGVHFFVPGGGNWQDRQPLQYSMFFSTTKTFSTSASVLLLYPSITLSTRISVLLPLRGLPTIATSFITLSPLGLCEKVSFVIIRCNTIPHVRLITNK